MKHLFLFFSILAFIPNYGVEFYTDFENLKPGKKGYALTVFKGTEPERMELEVVDFMPKRFSAQSMLIIKLSGENVERSRVAAGMSGSPVYIDDKLVGALAYTWANSRELIAGVTLIQDMIDEEARGSILPAGAQSIQTAWHLEGVDDPELLKTFSQASSASRPGFEPSIVASSSISNGISPFKAGDSVAIKLAEGDISLASIGTVTHVDGDKVYIYGHPMDQEGTFTLPLAKSRIHTILSSTELSFKMGTATETVGATVFDGLAAVYGRTDRAAPMTRVSMNFNIGGKDKKYNFRVARSPKYLPSITAAAINGLFTKELGKNIEPNILIEWRIRFTNGKTISNSVIWTKDAEYDPAVLKEFWRQYISIVWENHIVALVPEDIALTIRVENTARALYGIQDLRAERYDFFPGETINMRLALARPQEGVLLTNISFTLPKNMKSGNYNLYVGSKASLDAELVMNYLEARAARTENTILKELGSPINTQELVIALVEPERGSLTGTSFLRNIPISRRSLFQGKDIFGKSIHSPKLTTTSVKLDRTVTGLARLSLNVQNLQPINAEPSVSRKTKNSSGTDNMPTSEAANKTSISIGTFY